MEDGTGSAISTLPPDFDHCQWSPVHSGALGDRSGQSQQDLTGRLDTTAAEYREQTYRKRDYWEVEVRAYDHAYHGFGTGAGTDADGWMDEAISF